MSKTKVTYEFSAFPAIYWGKKGDYRMSCFSNFAYDNLAEARQEIRRLKKIYAIKEKRRRPGEAHAHLLNDYNDHYDYLKIVRVERTLLDGSRRK